MVVTKCNDSKSKSMIFFTGSTNLSSGTVQVQFFPFHHKKKKKKKNTSTSTDLIHLFDIVGIIPLV